MFDTVPSNINLAPESGPNGVVAQAHSDAPALRLVRVLVVTDDNAAADRIIQYLKPLKFDPHISFFDGRILRGTPKNAPHIILFALSDYVEHAPNLQKALLKHYTGYTIPVIAALSRKANIDTSGFDSVIYPPAHPSQIATRVDSMVRLRSMEREIMRRIETLSKDFDVDYILTDDALSKPFRVLFVGKASPEFMIVINALQEKNVDVVAAFTTFTAFDYLHDRMFDAVVMNALQDCEPAMTISHTMRRNSKLYHVPTLFLIDDSFDQHKVAFESGARDLIDVNSTAEEISGRILELANYHRIHNQLKREFDDVGGPRCVDGESGTFNQAFFYAHMDRVCDAMKDGKSSAAIMAIKVAPKAGFPVSDVAFANACANVGGMIKSLVRMQDVTARVEDDVFMIAFPDETADSISAVRDRIQGIVDCAAFQNDNTDQPSFTVTMDIAIVEMLEHETSDMFIGKAMGELSHITRQALTG